MGAIATIRGAVLIHSEYGKDRAGLVAALLLDLAGVCRELIAEDYALTAKVPEAYRREVLERLAWRAQRAGGGCRTFCRAAQGHSGHTSGS